MITNRDIELAFVRAQNRINEQIEKAQFEFMLPDVLQQVNDMAGMVKKARGNEPNINNPIANEEM